MMSPPIVSCSNCAVRDSVWRLLSIERTNFAGSLLSRISFAAWQSIHARFLWPIAQHETILHQFAFNCLNRALDALVTHRQKTGERHCKQARVQRIGPINLRESFLLRVIAAFANFGMNLI